jgi:hypothetical protein
MPPVNAVCFTHEGIAVKAIRRRRRRRLGALAAAAAVALTIGGVSFVARSTGTTLNGKLSVSDCQAWGLETSAPVEVFSMGGRLVATTEASRRRSAGSSWCSVRFSVHVPESGVYAVLIGPRFRHVPSQECGQACNPWMSLGGSDDYQFAFVEA